jgi:uncharacterized glyoxalase superfamily protein PhnB
MKRMHIHISVDDLGRSVEFYSTLFGNEPAVLKHDYAKWMLDDPKVNLAISQRGQLAGVDHLGIQVETDDELRDLANRLKTAGEATRDEEAATCCYAQSHKAWVSDPSGVRWETFFTFGEATTYGEEPADISAPPEQPAASCSPKSACC